MLKDITIGQYFPGDSILHRLDPRAKLIAVFLYIVALFVNSSWLANAVMLILTIILMAVSGIPPRHILRGLRPMLFIILLTGILNLFFTKGTPVLPGWIITWEGISQTIKMMLRITMLIIGTFLLTYTTSPMQITDGLEYLLSPLKRLHVPVHELTLIMSMALRFIPTLIEETDKIMSAQKSREADFETGGLVQRAKALIPVLVPLFVSSFRRADELAVAMESRCYHGGEGRTRMHELVYTRRDIVAICLAVALLGLLIILR